MRNSKILGRLAAGTDRYHLTVGEDNLEARQTPTWIASRNTVEIVISANFFPLCSTARLSQCRAGSATPKDRGTQGANGMVFRFTAQRHMRLAVTLLALCCVAGARAEDAARAVAAATTRGDADTGRRLHPARRAGRRRGGDAAATTPPAAEAHRLPPDSTTKQTLALPGRTLNFTATAGSIRLFDDKGEPQADIAYTSYQLDGTDRATRPVTFLFNGGPGRVVGLAAVRRCRAVAAVDSAATARCLPPRRSWCPTPRPGSTSPISSSSIPSAPATAASSPRARTCASGSSRSTATSVRSRW